MPTDVTFYEEPLNIDYLMSDVRFMFGDIDGSIYSDTIIRTAIVNAIKFLGNKWYARYQVFSESMVIEPQPDDAPAGYVYANTASGAGYIPDNLEPGDVFRNPLLTFTQDSPPIVQTGDEIVIALAATLLLRRSQVASSATLLVSWATEDIRYSNLSSNTALDKLLAGDMAAFNDWFKKRLGAAQGLQFDQAVPLNSDY